MVNSEILEIMKYRNIGNMEILPIPLGAVFCFLRSHMGTHVRTCDTTTNYELLVPPLRDVDAGMARPYKL